MTPIVPRRPLCYRQPMTMLHPIFCPMQTRRWWPA